METSEANKRFYNLVAYCYDKVDGRKEPEEWLDKMIYSLSIGRQDFLDIGAGTGYITKIAAKYFDKVTAYDASESMLLQIPRIANVKTIAGYAENLNRFDWNSFDVVCTFATLHHIKNLVKVFQEIHRVLRTGGIYYSDHDIEEHFVKRHRFLLKIYRFIKDKKRDFAFFEKEAGKLYDQTEHWSNGIDSDRIRITLTAIGFKVYITYHWQGGGLPINGESKKGYGPYMRIIAIKQRSSVMELQDKRIQCNDCKNFFTFTAGEQEFYQERGFSEPKRCKECRQKRKEKRGKYAYKR